MNILKLLAFLRGYIIYILKALIKHCLSADIVRFTQLLRKKIFPLKTANKATFEAPINSLSVRVPGWFKHGLGINTRSQNGYLKDIAVSTENRRVLFVRDPWHLSAQSLDQRRTNVAPSSGMLRLLFGCYPKRSRTAVEAEPKRSRTCPEQVSNSSRRNPGAESKASRRGVKVSPAMDFFLTNFAPTPAFYAIGLRFSSAVPSVLSEGDPRPTRAVSEGASKQTRKSSGEKQEPSRRKHAGLFLVAGATRSVLFIYRECTEKVQLVYWECTKKVLRVYYECTRKVLNRNQILTGKLQTICSSGLDMKYLSSNSSVLSVQDADAILDNRVGGRRFDFKAFQALYSAVVGKDEYLFVWFKSVAQNALKSFNYLNGYKKTFRMLLACFTILHMFSLSAQTPRKDSGADGLFHIRPLQIGDKIPESLWDTPLQVVNHPAGKQFIKLSDYRHKKLIILDFWASWCSACIAAMPRIKELEEKYQEDVTVIAVTREEASKSKKFLTTNETIKKLGIYSIVTDTLLRTVFPHQLIPHYVWISSDGIVGAVTSSAQLTEGNITHFLDDNTVQIPVRELIDPNRPLFLSDKIQLKDLSFFSVLTQDAVDGLPSGNRYREENGITRGRAITNSSLEFLFSSAARGILQRRGKQLLDKEILVEVQDSSRFYPVRDRDILSNVFNYELIVPTEKADSLYQYMLTDLNRYTSYRATLERRKIKCLALRKKGNLSLLGSKGGKRENTLPYNKPSKITNYPLSSLVSRLNDLDCFALPVIDETGYSDHVDLSFSGDLAPKILQAELNRQGLDLKKVTRTREVLVIRDK